jgi:IS4 transposase
LCYIERGILSEFTGSFSAMLRDVFNEKELQKKAVASGFYKRKCGFTPAMFFDILLYCASLTEVHSLSQVSTTVKTMHGLKIAKQSIDGRFNEGAVAFVKEMLKELLERQLSKVFCADFLSQFNHVRIKDSTRFTVPDKLKEHFKGSGGGKGTSNACVCIQYEYDARSGKVLDLNVTNGTRNDATDASETKTKIDIGDLVLRDLGYFNLSVLTGFVGQGGSFISRLNTSILVFEPDAEEEINFKELYGQMHRQQQARCDKQVLVGKGKMEQIRLIVEIVPEQVYQERIRKVNKFNKEKGWTTSEEYKARCRFNMFITNVPKEELSIEEAMLIYRLRWQVELMFKNWKSVCKIDKIQPMKYERFACLLFAKLILIMLNIQIVCNMQVHYFKKRRLILSENKCFKTLRESFGILRGIWIEKKTRSEKKLKSLVVQFSSNHWKEKRKNKVNFIEIVELFICSSIYYKYIRDIKKGTNPNPSPNY